MDGKNVGPIFCRWRGVQRLGISEDWTDKPGLPQNPAISPPIAAISAKLGGHKHCTLSVTQIMVTSSEAISPPQRHTVLDQPK